MNEAEALAWLAQQFGTNSAGTLGRYVELVRAESDRQNLVAASTLATIWSRHIVDSAQLLLHAPNDWRRWVDIGSGAGFPGLVVAALEPARDVVLLEPRRLRAEFLQRCARELGLPQVAVIQDKAERYAAPEPASVISARAVAPLEQLLASTAHLADRSTVYILPKGAGAQSEVAVARRSWHGTFHVKQSIVDPTSGVVIASGLRRR